MGRTGWTAAVAFAAGLAVGLGARGCDAPPPPEIAPVSAPAGAASAVRGRESPKRPRRPASDAEATGGRDTADAPAPAPAAAPAPSQDVREIPLDDVATGFVEIDVEVVDADGKPIRNAYVYALPVGAPGEDNEDLVPNAYVRDGGRCRLVLPSPGSFDVVAMGEFVHTRIEGVRVPGPASLRIQLPATVVATFVLDPEFPPAGDVDFSIQAAPSPALRRFPARGDPRSTNKWGGTVGPARPRHELPLGPLEFEVTQPSRFVIRNNIPVHEPPEFPAVFEPRRFVPPATIRVRGADPSARTLDVALTFEEPEGAVRRDRHYPIRMEFDDVVVGDTVWFSWDGRGPTQLVRKQAVRTPVGTLRWSGPRLVPGGVRWDLDRSAGVEATVVVRPLVPDDGVRVVVDLPRDEAHDEGRVFVYHHDPDDLESARRALVPVGEEVLLETGGEWLLVDVDLDEGPLTRRVAGPVRGQAGTVVTMKPRPGGYVVFAPGSTPPEGAGAIVITRADGAPFPYRQYDADRHGRRAVVAPGAVLGPFEPGVVTFDVRVGGTAWGRHEVTVRQNAWTPFVVRPFR